MSDKIKNFTVSFLILSYSSIMEHWSIGQQNKSMLEQIGTEINLIGGLETSLHDMAVRSPRTLEPKYVSK